MDVSQAGLMGLAGYANALAVVPGPGSQQTVERELFGIPGVTSALPVTANIEVLRDRMDDFVGVLRERAPSFVDVLAGLRERVGEGDVAAHLEEVVRRGVQFYRESVPMAGALLASPALLAALGRVDAAAAG